jgi:hypothetical protein
LTRWWCHVCIILDQQLDFYCASSQTQQSARRHVTLYCCGLSIEAANTNCIVLGLTWWGCKPSKRSNTTTVKQSDSWIFTTFCDIWQKILTINDFIKVKLNNNLYKGKKNLPLTRTVNVWLLCVFAVYF